jgi:hypothetical protein
MQFQSKTLITSPFAVFSNARRRLVGETLILSARAAEATRAKQPAALGEDMDVPFISCWEFPVQTGTCMKHQRKWVFIDVDDLRTQVIAAPGADILTPAPPSQLGPRDDHV